MTLLAGYAFRYEGSERTKPRPACADDPLAWDLDTIYGRLPDIMRAVDNCHACPILDLCNAYTKGWLRQGLKIQSVVQAGLVWPAANGPKIPDEIRAELIKRRLLGNKRRFLK